MLLSLAGIEDTQLSDSSQGRHHWLGNRAVLFRADTHGKPKQRPLSLKGQYHGPSRAAREARLSGGFYQGLCARKPEGYYLL